MSVLKKNISILILAGFLAGCSPYIHKIKAPGSVLAEHQLHEILEEEYPFTEHKGIDWHQFAHEMQVLLVGNSFNEEAYLKTRYRVYNMPDSRLNIFSNQDDELRKQQTSGYIGFELAFSPPNNYFVARIDSQSEAWDKGIRQGFQIIGWNGKHIRDAIDSYPLAWGFNPSTDELRKVLSCHWVCRGKAGTTAEIFFINEQENNKGVRLSFTEETESDFPSYIRIPTKTLDKKHEFRLISEGIGYLRMDHFIPSSISFFRNEVVDKLAGLNGLIIDLRENSGGYDGVAVQIAGHFITETRLYEESFILNKGEYNIFGSHLAEPAEAAFTKNIILLTGPMTMGVAEGFANILKDEEHIRTLGSWNTAGSFSLPGGQIKLGKGIKLNYPVGGGLDENHNIILESGKWIKGIYPDVYIPPTKEFIMLKANGYDILLEEALAHILR